jgi:hypothetical protein
METIQIVEEFIYRALAQLFEHLNNAEVKYPGTELRLVYELGGYSSPD